MSAARTAPCKTTEITNARRRTRCSRVRCSASPSTRQAFRKPELSLETGWGSTDITHLHTRMLRGSGKKFCGAGFLCASHRRAAPRSQGCEVARVLTAFDTNPGNKFPEPRGIQIFVPPSPIADSRSPSNVVKVPSSSQITENKKFIKTVSKWHPSASHLSWTWI
jgi:hypothetical protein